MRSQHAAKLSFDPSSKDIFHAEIFIALCSLDQRYNEGIIKARFSLIPNNGEKKRSLDKIWNILQLFMNSEVEDIKAT